MPLVKMTYLSLTTLFHFRNCNQSFSNSLVQCRRLLEVISHSMKLQIIEQDLTTIFVPSKPPVRDEIFFQEFHVSNSFSPCK